MEADKAALDKAPENAELKTKFDAAKKLYDDAVKAAADDESGDEDESGWDDKTKAYIQKLRKEAADNRTKAKDLKSKLSSEEEKRKAILKAAGIETEEENPAEQLKGQKAVTNQLLFRNAILESAVEHGITGENLDYYQFLVTKEAEKLEEGAELSDEQMAGIVAKVKRAGGSGAANTSVNGKDGKGSGKAPNPDGSGAVTLGQFAKMNITQKSELYTKNPDLYSTLMNEARQKNMLV